MISIYIHGTEASDAELFCQVGRFALNPKIHTELGNAITSIAGDEWYLYQHDGQTVGFANVRVDKQQRWHLRYLWADGAGIKVRDDLIKAVLKQAKKAKAPLVFTNDRISAGIWKLHGFVPGEQKRGEFVRWEKTL